VKKNGIADEEANFTDRRLAPLVSRFSANAIVLLDPFNIHIRLIIVANQTNFPAKTQMN